MLRGASVYKRVYVIDVFTGKNKLFCHLSNVEKGLRWWICVSASVDISFGDVLWANGKQMKRLGKHLPFLNVKGTPLLCSQS